MMKRALLLMFVVGSSALLGAQATPTSATANVMSQSGDIQTLSGGVTLHTGDNVMVRTETAEFDRTTGEMRLSDPVVLRQAKKPPTQSITAVNLAGEPFPEAKPVIMRMRGDIQITAGELTVRADEVDVDGATGDMTLRGNVRISRPNWKTSPAPSPAQP